MGSKEQIIQLRTENPLMNSVDIGKKVGTSKQYVHKILKKAGLDTRVPKRKKSHRCLFCDEVIFDSVKKSRLCSDPCHFQWYYLQVNCSFCHAPFYRTRGGLIQNHRRKLNNIYCSRGCRDKGKSDLKNVDDAKVIYRQQQEDLYAEE